MPPKSKNSQPNSNKNLLQDSSMNKFTEQDPEIKKILQKSDLSPQNSMLLQSMFEYFEFKLAKKDQISDEAFSEIKKMQTEIHKIEKIDERIHDLEETVEIKNR